MGFALTPWAKIKLADGRFFLAAMNAHTIHDRRCGRLRSISSTTLTIRQCARFPCSPAIQSGLALYLQPCSAALGATQIDTIVWREKLLAAMPTSVLPDSCIVEAKPHDALSFIARSAYSRCRS